MVDECERAIQLRYMSLILRGFSFIEAIESIAESNIYNLDDERGELLATLQMVTSDPIIFQPGTFQDYRS